MMKALKLAKGKQGLEKAIESCKGDGGSYKSDATLCLRGQQCMASWMIEQCMS